jgi:uncharacterized protein (DUF2141 family)
MPTIIAFSLFTAVTYANELAVTITDIREAKGSLMVAVVNSEAAWNDKEKPVAVQKIAAAQGEMTLHFGNLPAGTYAVKLMHDQNGNDKLDTNFLGIPLEGYGFSNNPNVMRRPYFDEARFELAEKAAITVRLR